MTRPSPSSASELLVPGAVIAEKYRVERVLGRGGMGLVVAAFHLELEQKVAIKVALGDALEAVAVERFLREARAAAKIHGEHVARVMDVGRLDDGAPFIVMEFLDGETLAELVARRGPLPFAEAVEHVMQALEAVAQAHALGIVHRDLKPSNLFVTAGPDGAPLVKVLDFGISKISPPAGSGASDLTSTLVTLGSPAYMSPEQLRSSKDVDARADVWALGVVLYELISARRPFEAETLTALSVMIATEEPWPLRAHVPDVPPALEAVVLRCLSKDASARWGSVGELARALSAFAPEGGRAAADRIGGILRVRGPGRGSVPSLPDITLEPAGASSFGHLSVPRPAASSSPALGETLPAGSDQPLPAGTTPPPASPRPSPPASPGSPASLASPAAPQPTLLSPRPTPRAPVPPGPEPQLAEPPPPGAQTGVESSVSVSRPVADGRTRRAPPWLLGLTAVLVVASALAFALGRRDEGPAPSHEPSSLLPASSAPAPASAATAAALAASSAAPWASAPPPQAEPQPSSAQPPQGASPAPRPSGRPPAAKPAGLPPKIPHGNPHESPIDSRH